MSDGMISYLKKEGYKNLILKTCLVIFLLLATYIAYYGFYNKKYLPTRLSGFQYSTAKAATDLASIDNSIETKDMLTYASDISQCPPGQCAINITTGVKRCPQNTTNKLTYDITKEACTRLEFCDYKSLPYAVSTNGQASSSMCDPGPQNTKIPCRCVANQTCPNHVLAKFSVGIGSINGVDQNSTPKSFTLKQDVINNQENLGYSNITISDTSSEFCQINPGFTDVLTNGCNFENSSGDKLGCQFIDTVSFGTVGTNPLNWNLTNQRGDDGPPGLKQFVDGQNPVSSSGNIEIGMRYFVISKTVNVNDTDPVLPEGGYIKIMLLDGSTSNSTFEVVKYSGLRKFLDNPSGIDTEYIVLTNIVNIESSSLNNIQGSNGFLLGWNATDSTVLDNTSLLLEDIVSSNCILPNDQPNYKNMLLCTQIDRQPCATGNFMYNFDKIRDSENLIISNTDEGFTRNFCQLNQAGIINSNPTYLEDPTYYTLACSIGSGCNGKNFASSDTSDIETEARQKYFPDVDVNGINGIWQISTSTYPILDMKNTGELLNNNTIQAGDFWSIKTVNQTLISSSSAEPGASIIFVQDLFGLGEFVNTPGEINKSVAPKIFISGTSYRLTDASFKYDETTNTNTSSIGISPGLSAPGITQYSLINIIPPNMYSLDSYGMIVTSKTDNKPTVYQLYTLDGGIIPSNYEGVGINLTVYKQFSFSGPNYTTKVMPYQTKELSNSEIVSYGNTRQYTQMNGVPYEFQYSPVGESESYVTTKRPPQNTSQLDFPSYSNTYREQAMSSSNIPFKVPISMYYPVWNPVMYQEECIRCKPLLVSYPEISEVDNSINNVIIQFSGKDFGNYEYNARDNDYCYTTLSELDSSSEQTTQRIVLSEPNPNVRVGDYVLDSLLQFDFDTVSSNPNMEKKQYNDLTIIQKIFPSQNAINIFKDNIPTNWLPYSEGGWGGIPRNLTSNNISFGLEESESSNKNYNDSVEYCSRNITVNWDSSLNSWKTTTEAYLSTPSNPVSIGPYQCANYFFGKKYQDPYDFYDSLSGTSIDTNGFYFVPKRKVLKISEDKKTFEISSQFPATVSDTAVRSPMLPEEVQILDYPYKNIIQFCRLDSPIGLCVTTAGGTPLPGTEIKINAISDSRITDIIISKSSDSFLPENPPIIQIDTTNQNFM